MNLRNITLYVYLDQHVSLYLISANALALQTQMSLDANLEIDVKKAQVIDNVLTIILVFRNTSGAKAKISLAPGQIHYIDAKQNKKYHILKDEKTDYILAPPHITEK